MFSSIGNFLRPATPDAHNVGATTQSASAGGMPAEGPRPPNYQPAAPGEASMIHEVIDPAAEMPGTTAVRELFARPSSEAVSKQLEVLAEMEAEAASAGIEGFDKQAYKEQFKLAFQHTLHRYSDPDASLLPAEKALLGKLQEAVAEAVASDRHVSTPAEQVKNNIAAATFAACTGFGAVALVMKVLTNFTPLGASASHFVNLTGPLILLVAELLAGKYKAQGAGYTAVDSDAYQEFDKLNAQIFRLGSKVEGMRANSATPQAEIDAVVSEMQKLQLGRQKMVFDCLTRELGHDTGLKAEGDLPDVPKNTLLACVRSQLTGDLKTGEVRLPDGTLLFQVLNDKGDVQWPSLEVTNLLKEQVPAEFMSRFDEAAVQLAGAARCRSAMCDDIPFQLFGLPFLWNSAGPFLLATQPHGEVAAKVGDTLLMVASSVIGTYVLINAQNFMRSVYSGAGKSTGLHTEASHAKHELAKFKEQTLSARLESANHLIKEFKTEIADFQTSVAQAQADVDRLRSRQDALLARVDAAKDRVRGKTVQVEAAEHALKNAKTQGHPAQEATVQSLLTQRRAELATMQQDLQDLQMSVSDEKDVITDQLLAALDRLEDMHVEVTDRRNALARAEQIRDMLVKDHKAAERKVVDTGRKAGVTWALMKDTWRGYKNDPIRLAAKVIAYDLCYIAYGEFYTPFAAQSVSSLSGKMAMAAFGGTFMASIFLWRNTVFTPGIQYGLHALAGKIEGWQAARKDRPEAPADSDVVIQMPIDAAVVADAWVNTGDDLDAAFKPRLVNLVRDALSDWAKRGGAIEPVLQQYVDRIGDEALGDLHAATQSLLDDWEQWSERFGEAAPDMRRAIDRMHDWADGQVQRRQLQ